MQKPDVTPEVYRIEGRPAPGDLVHIQGFLNTWSAELDIEDLSTPPAARAWLRRSGLLPGRSALSDAELLRLRAFREALRRYLRDAEDAAPLRTLLAPLSLRPRIGPQSGLSLEPNGTGCELTLGRLAAIIVAATADGTWQRLKCCALASCGWAFYDHTRSRTKRWCSMQTCGSRHKARAYYHRQRGRQ